MSQLFQLKLNDFFKGLVMSSLLGSLTTIYSAFTSACGVGCIDWNLTMNVGIGAGIAYLIKNYLSDERGNFAGLEI